MRVGMFLAYLSVWRVSRLVLCDWSGLNVEVDSMIEVGCWGLWLVVSRLLLIVLMGYGL